MPLLALAAAAAADHAVPADVTASRDIFDVLHFGARGDGSTNDGPAIGRAYAACAAAGGGTVVFAAGRTFLTGPMQLACNNSVTVLEPGTVVRAVNSTAGWGFGPDCPEPAQGESARQMAPLVLVEHGRNVTVRGGGTFDARGEMWWANACGNEWCPAGRGSTAVGFRPFLFRVDHSSGVTIENVSLVNSGFWTLVPVHSQRLRFADLTISAEWSGAAAARGCPSPHCDPPRTAGQFDRFRTPNTDGIEPMWSSDVHITGCWIKNGDDWSASQQPPRLPALLGLSAALHLARGIVCGCDM